MSTRFAFGRNWRDFVRGVGAPQVEEAAKALLRLVDAASWENRAVLDVGCGSGLSSIAMLRLGARRVHGFDHDAESVAAASLLRDQLDDGALAERWTVEYGDVLDERYMRRLGLWDIVYSWGVLHHTGDMWRALAIASKAVTPNGTLIVALYNDQGWKSKLWRVVKRIYNTGPLGQAAMLGIFVPVLAGGGALNDLRRGHAPWRRYRTLDRGMRPWNDWIDWIGGFPFEVATPTAVITFLEHRGFAVARVIDVGRRLGCNEFVFHLRETAVQ